MPKDDVERVLREALLRHSRLRDVSIGPDDRLDARAGLDSFALLNALLEVEDALGVEIDQGRLADVRAMTFAQLVAMLETLTEQAPA